MLKGFTVNVLENENALVQVEPVVLDNRIHAASSPIKHLITVALWHVPSSVIFCIFVNFGIARNLRCSCQ